jgi:hypothetical protein
VLGLQLLFSDNGGEAAPVGFDDGDLTVLMNFPAAYGMVTTEGPAAHGRTSHRPQADEAERNHVAVHRLAAQGRSASGPGRAGVCTAVHDIG